LLDVLGANYMQRRGFLKVAALAPFVAGRVLVANKAMREKRIVEA